VFAFSTDLIDWPLTMSNDLRVPKDIIAVELAIAGSPARRMELFVAAGQGLRELLENGDSFVPARDLADRHGVIVNKAAIAWVALPLAVADDGELFDVRCLVRVELTGGGALEGELLSSPPAGRQRVVDQLNEAGAFVRLWMPERVCFVNKRMIARVLEKDGGG
jgi:hypothetical protein